jgi:hypothetical protein
MKFLVKVEDSMYKTQVINLCSFDSVVIPKEAQDWARDGQYHEVSCTKDGITTTYKIDAEDVRAYHNCLRHNISQKDYEVYLRVSRLL